MCDNQREEKTFMQTCSDVGCQVLIVFCLSSLGERIGRPLRALRSLVKGEREDQVDEGVVREREGGLARIGGRVGVHGATQRAFRAEVSRPRYIRRPGAVTLRRAAPRAPGRAEFPETRRPAGTEG
jgi:hypothetical protein